MVAGRNAAAAIVDRDQILAAASQERFNRIKGSELFPLEAIHACCKHSGLALSEIEFAAHGFDFQPHRAVFLHMEHGRSRYQKVMSPEAIRGEAERQVPDFDWEHKLTFVPHHEAHAASAFSLSPFDEALIVVADGMGEFHSLTIFHAAAGRTDVLRRVPAGHSLGILYGIFTHFLGFTMDRDECKVMGLAAFGDADVYRAAFDEFVVLHAEGQVTIPLLRKNLDELERETHAGVLRELERHFGPARIPGAPLTRREADLAAGVQHALERAMIHVLAWFRKQAPAENLCLAGGVTLNSSMNRKIVESGMFRSLFVQPAASDEGTALGAAIFVEQRKNKIPRMAPMQMPYWGPEDSDEEIRRALKEGQIRNAACLDFEQLIEAVVSLLAEGKVVGWHQGRMEFGPRALGNRSMLADPKEKAIRNRINRLVKDREDFRPFAPVVASEHANRIFEIDQGSEHQYRHMVINAGVREEYRTRLGAVTHCDGSARLQVLFEEDNPFFYRLISSFGERSGLPVLLNTSLNIRGEPIACTAADSVRVFRESALDALAIGSHLLLKK